MEELIKYFEGLEARIVAQDERIAALEAEVAELKNRPLPEPQVVEKVVEKIVEVPVEKVVEKIVEVPSGENHTGSPLLVNINYVQPNPNQPRKIFNEEKIKELSESIKNYGVIEPIIVRKVGPVHYEVMKED